MIQIHFPDAESKRQALGWLAGRFTFKSWASGEMIVPADALPYLAMEGIPFVVDGRATYEQMALTIRTPPAVAV